MVMKNKLPYTIESYCHWHGHGRVALLVALAKGTVPCLTAIVDLKEEKTRDMMPGVNPTDVGNAWLAMGVQTYELCQ